MAALADRIYPLIDVAPGELDDVARAAFGSAAVIAERAALEGGLSHTPFRVRLDDGTQWVFRFCAGKLERFERERRLLTELRDRLPVPQLAWSRATGKPVLVLRWVDGIPLWQLRRDHPEHLLALAAPLAELLARVSTCEAIAGAPLPERSVKTSDDPVALTLQRLSSEPARTRLGPTLADQLTALYQTQTQQLRALGPRGLCHGDLSLRNLIVSPADGRWQLAALIDWDEPFDGAAAWDVGHLFRYPKRFSAEFVSAFEKAHRRTGALLPDDWWRTSRLLDAMRFIETLDKPPGLPAVFDELRELLGSLASKSA